MSALDSKRFRALGQDWTARFGHNAICALEEDTGRSFGAIVSPFLVQLDEKDRKDPTKLLQAMEAIRFADIRLVLFYVLSGQHPDLTLEETGELIDALGLSGAMEVVAWAIMRAMPAEDNDAEGGASDGDVDPPKAPVKTANRPVNRKQRKAAAKAG